jgi:integrase
LKGGRIRARLPGPARPAREFPAGHMAEATAWLDAALAPGAPDTTAPVTLREWTGVWYQTYVAPLRPPNTARWYRYALQRLGGLYGVPVADVRASALQGVVAQVGATLDPATVQGIVGVWRRCLAAAVEDELIARNPAARLTLPRSAPRVVKRHVTPAEIAALWPAITGHRFEAAYALLLGCGLRIGEVLGLAWEHVDLAGRRAWIQRQWTNSHWRELPKSRRPRWVRLPDPVVRALIRHRNAQPAGAIYVMQSPHATSFGPRKRERRQAEVRPWSAQVVGRDLRALIDATPHAFRRGLVSALLDGGASPAIVADIVGHADPATTLRHYAAQSPEARAQADELVDRYLGGDPEAAAGTETAC